MKPTVQSIAAKVGEAFPILKGLAAVALTEFILKAAEHDEAPTSTPTVPQDWDVTLLAKDTSDAYSADCYTSWTACARVLQRRGYGRQQLTAETFADR